MSYQFGIPVVVAVTAFLGTRTALLLLSRRMSYLARWTLDLAEIHARRSELLPAQIHFALGQGFVRGADWLYRLAIFLRPYLF